MFAYGDAKYEGSAATVPLSAPIVGISPTSTGSGYYLVGADGGVFAYGDAKFSGTISTTLGTPTPSPAVGITADPVGAGYLITTAAGGVYAFGGAPFYSSPLLAGTVPNGSVVSITYTPDAKGYWVSASDGGVFNYQAPTGGDATFFGSVPGLLASAGLAATPPSPIVGFAAAP